MLLLLIVSIIIIAWIDISSILKKRLFKEGFVSVGLYLFALSFSIYIQMTNRPPTPLEGVAKIFDPITKSLLGILQL